MFSLLQVSNPVGKVDFHGIFENLIIYKKKLFLWEISCKLKGDDLQTLCFNYLDNIMPME